MKELTFQEVVSEIKSGEKYICTTNIYRLKTIYHNGACINFTFSDTACEKDGMISAGANLEARFIKEINPVSFMDAINSDSRILVTHDILDRDGVKVSYSWGDEILKMLSINFTQKAIAEIINNGKWYIEQ